MVDELDESAGGLIDGLDILVLLFLFQPLVIVQEQSRVPLDDGQRSAQLVGDRREEVALELV